MTLSDDHIDAIRRTWAMAVQTGPIAANLFYGQLFRIAPGTRRLFNDDRTAQNTKLLATLGFIVENLDRPDVLEPAARALAIRHVDYGVVADDYGPVGAALIWMLQEVLGPRFTADAREAWLTAYSALAELMVGAAYAHDS